MRIDHELRGDTLIVRLEGEFDLEAAAGFRALVDGELRTGRARALLLNLERVTFIDSSGLGAILGRYREVAEAAGHMAIVGSAPSTRRMLQMSGLLRILPLYADEEQALAAG